MRSLELFTGAGGLAIGTSRAGFRHQAVIERDGNACSTMRYNRDLGIHPVSEWPIYEMDVADFDYATIQGEVDLLAGGPPCQPFSIGGKHRGHNDERNMFPEVLRAIRELKPRAILIENVKGLLRQSFSTYFEYIRLQLEHPEITRRNDELWTQHLSHLERHHTGGLYEGLHYKIVVRLLNAANYGIPQKRERVFIVGFRSDIEQKWSFPAPTHSLDALLWTQWKSGEYWERHEIARNDRPKQPARFQSRIRQIPPICRFSLEPWKTVRDTISDLPDPENDGFSDAIPNHRLNPGAKGYTGHTGSPLDEPAKTLKAGDHGVPGGENMLVKDNGKVRYFTVRESARLQTFPDDFVFQGSWTEAMRQLGNAVPATLAEIVAKEIHGVLKGKVGIESGQTTL
ncbi:MAG: DNA cytosine methyltransferase [Syntrophobacteraceae bacterium]|nr:DNA cytosine methyltransferase [Syntrophobacteraceae bacterium]